MDEHPQPLAPDDARILALESDAVLGHTLKLLVLEPGSALDLDRVRARVAGRLGAIPRALERVETGPDGPAWVPVADVDLDAHVRQHSADSPADLRAVVDGLMSERLDRTRPLWSIDVVGPLVDGREAIAVRIHHAMADGLGAVRFVDGALFEPHDPPVRRPGVAATARPTRWRAWERMPRALVRELGERGSRSPFDRAITSARAVSFADLPLEDVRRLGRARPAHATVNDVLLAVVAGGLRRWHDATHTDHRLPRLRAQVPVSLHREGEAFAGNRDSFLDVDLLLGEDDDVRRLDRIAAQTRARKRDGDAEILDGLFRVLDADGLGAVARRFADDPRVFGVAVSNVPGPGAPVEVAGRRVEHIYSSSEPGARHALRIAAISNDRWLGVGFCVDPTVVPGVEGLADATHDAFEALLAAASPAP